MQRPVEEGQPAAEKRGANRIVEELAHGFARVFALEEEFAVDIPDEAVKEFTSVRDVVVGIERLLARKDA